MNEIFGTNCDFKFHRIIVYDFESLCLKQNTNITNTFKITNQQQAVSVSLYSNIEGYEKEIFIESHDVKILFSKMFEYLDKMVNVAVAQMLRQLDELFCAVSEDEVFKGKKTNIQ
jgi:hypothetical protein